MTSPARSTREERGEPTLWFVTCANPESPIMVTTQDKVATTVHKISDERALRFATDLLAALTARRKP